MKKAFLSIGVAALALMFNSCMTPSTGLGTGSGLGAASFGGVDTSATPTTPNTGAGNTQSLLGNLISGLLSSAVPLTQQTLIGTWSYQAPECRFESENALAQAGGMVAAGTIEQKLAEAYAKVGIVPGACSFTFNADNTCVIVMGQMAISGSYTFDPKTHDLNIVSSTGLIRLNAKVYYDLNSLTIMFDANKLLSLVQSVSAFAGKANSTVGSLTGLLGNYKGLQLGMSLAKQ